MVLPHIGPGQTFYAFIRTLALQAAQISAINMLLSECRILGSPYGRGGIPLLRPRCTCPALKHAPHCQRYVLGHASVMQLLACKRGEPVNQLHAAGWFLNAFKAASVFSRAQARWGRSCNSNRLQRGLPIAGRMPASRAKDIWR